MRELSLRSTRYRLHNTMLSCNACWKACVLASPITTLPLELVYFYLIQPTISDVSFITPQYEHL